MNIRNNDSHARTCQHSSLLQNSDEQTEGTYVTTEALREYWENFLHHLPNLAETMFVPLCVLGLSAATAVCLSASGRAFDVNADIDLSPTRIAMSLGVRSC